MRSATWALLRARWHRIRKVRSAARVRRRRGMARVWFGWWGIGWSASAAVVVFQDGNHNLLPGFVV